MPNVEYRGAYEWETCTTTMPHEVWTQLSPHAQHITATI